MQRWLSVLAGLSVACSGDEEPPPPVDTTSVATVPTGDTGPVGFGNLVITFAIDPDYAAGMSETPDGPFWGDVFASSDVTAIGPNPGAQAIATMSLPEFVLAADGTATAALVTIGPLPAIEVTVLGFLDSDGNADPLAPEPDSGDPVTLPFENEFQVVADTDTTVQVYFGFLNP